MDRRPRPASGRPPASAATSRASEKQSKLSSNRPEDTASEHHSSSDSEGQPESDLEEQDEALEDPDGPGVAQWIDEDELDDVSDENEQDRAGEGKTNRGQLESLKDDLSALPFGSLRKAQRALAQASERENNTRDPGREGNAGRKAKKEIAARKNKHAPTEVTSKRPVSRHRTVVEVHHMEVRDPRFLPLAGEFDGTRFRQQYGFISTMHETELKTLRENLKRARKLLVSYPKDSREERELEVQRLELAVKRAESAVNRDKREKVEQEALGKASREEREKREKGKGRFWLKDSEKKKLLLKARYEAVAAEGGKGAVRKVIEKKQKKLSQKETKSRPFARQGGAGSATGRAEAQGGKRTRDDGYPQSKRRKVG
ncbi:DUF947-domain-containing protein [Artomyces pyxidatus]|uniref:DUF947-domain-containing protein n=1 Tax=Artomyces pyxidatus TaxID=48021 RepID=A0ACB8TID3_9AGAM|nr:DUF947-domain-containing protein [Artomyces pyxidatus]